MYLYDLLSRSFHALLSFSPADTLGPLIMHSHREILQEKGISTDHLEYRHGFGFGFSDQTWAV